MRRLFAAVLLLSLATALAATTSAAKEGVHARVATPVPRDARPGTTVTVVWTLYSVDAGTRTPFGADGIFIRLFGPGAARTPRAFATELAPGRYRARPRIPRGGVRRVAIGLMGTGCDASGCRPSPGLFRIVGPALR